jgi:hypothetical protein
MTPEEEELRALCKTAGMEIPFSGVMRPSQVCEVLDVCNGTLENWRRLGIGPPAQRDASGRYRYHIADVAKHWKFGQQGSTSANDE